MQSIIEKIAKKILATKKIAMNIDNIERVTFLEGNDFTCYIAQQGNWKFLIFYYEDGTMNILYL